MYEITGGQPVLERSFLMSDIENLKAENPGEFNLKTSSKKRVYRFTICATRSASAQTLFPT